jgi:hypothetical protein
LQGFFLSFDRMNRKNRWRVDGDGGFFSGFTGYFLFRGVLFRPFPARRGKNFVPA